MVEVQFTAEGLDTTVYVNTGCSVDFEDHGDSSNLEHANGHGMEWDYINDRLCCCFPDK